MTLRQKPYVWALAATFAFAPLAAIPVLAADPPAATPAPAATVTRTTGEIKEVSATSITIKPRNGDAKTFTINAATKIKLDGKDATAADLKTGQRVRVNSTDGTTATEISNRVRKPGGAPPAAGAPATPATP